MEIFTINHLSFAYPEQEKQAISDLTLSVQPGEFLVLCGPSGCGKSTLLRQFKTVLAPHGRRSGEILFDGKKLDELSQREQAETIGFVQQSPENQIATDKVWHELAFGLESLGYDTPTIRRRVAEMASFFGIQEWFYKPVTELSGGQKQLLNLASVMVLQPKVLILDEPTSQLDPSAASDFLATLGKINRELGTTILLTEHRLEEAFGFASRVAVMDKGRLLCTGTPAEVGAELKSSGNAMFLAMPAAMRIWAATDSKAVCPISVCDGRNWLLDYAKAHELKYRQDEDLNVIIWKDGSKGYDASEPVILQGHMDMVAVKEADCDKDMKKEGLDLEINGDYISAKGTSLGGDDGIAVAYTLAVLDDEEMAHPPIEAIFTVNEEIGMLGAATIDVSDLKGRLFMNMDSEDEGVFTVSCAGGASVICKIPYETETVNASVIEIKMTGFAGGHSGVEIIKGRLNANCAMARVLLSLFNEVEMQLVSVNGGEKDNAIAKFSEASVAVLPEELEAAKQIVEDTFAQIKEEYKVTDPDAKLTVNVKEAANIETFTEDTTFAVVTAMVHMPNGVQRMNPEIEGLVQTSLNMGILTTEESEVQMTFAVRSSSETEKQYLIDQLTSLTETLGGNVEIAGPYPGWEYKADSRLREVMVEAYKHLYNGEEPVVEGIHAGLECGIFASKLPGLDAVSFGPQMEHIHTTNEVLSISSTERTWELVVKTLAALK